MFTRQAAGSMFYHGHLAATHEDTIFSFMQTPVEAQQRHREQLVASSSLVNNLILFMGAISAGVERAGIDHRCTAADVALPRTTLSISQCLA